MKLNALSVAIGKLRPPQKILLVMKLTTIIILLAFLQCSAKVFSQKISLNETNTPLKKVLKVINSQTGYVFFYESKAIRNKNITIQVKDASLDAALVACLKNQHLSYEIVNNTIFIKEEQTPARAASIPAQQQVALKVSGLVYDEKNAPLPGVTVKLKGGTAAVVTDKDGKFNIDVPDAGAVLVFSFIGYTKQELTIVQGSLMTVHLQPEQSKLNEVVVVGYGTSKKSDLTGAVGSVRSEALQERPASSLNQALAGRISGVNVSSNSGRPGGKTNIRIRGSSSLLTTNNPLYVIDGVIMSNIDLRNGSTPIDYINPNDIASVEVLKDASSTAIYGARGANGVIMVTTKRGSTTGGKISYDPDYSIGVLPKELLVLNSKEFLALEDLAYANAAKYDPIGWATGTKYTDPKTKRTNPLLFDAQGNPRYDTDWQKLAFQKAFTQNQQLSFTDGDEKRSLGVYLNYRNQQGLARGSWQKRYSGRFVFDSQIKSWAKVGGTLGYTDQTDKQVDQVDGAGITMMRDVLEELPIIPVKYANGSWASNRDYPGMEGGDNPLRLAADRNDFLKTQTLLADVYATLHFVEGLDFKSTIGTNLINQSEQYSAAAGLQYISDKGDASVSNSRITSWQFENYLTYNKQFAKIHSINAVAGLSWQHNDRFDSYAASSNFFDPYFQFNNLGAGANPQAPSSGATAAGLNSYFARLNYGLYNKYLVTFTGRRDGSSKFGKNNQYAYFPSAALAWRVIEEDFIKAIPVISNLKLRASYGLTGNSEIAPYRANAGLTTDGYVIILDGNRQTGVGNARMANDNLKWEKTAQIDMGVELGLFANRVNFEFDLYRRKVNDMLLNQPLPFSSGFSSVVANVGSMENKGVELALNTVNIKTTNFSWSTTFNISVNKNKVLALAGGRDIFSGNGIIRVGEPVGSFYGRVSLGTWGTAEATEAKKYGMLPGDIKYKDLNNDGTINDLDRTIIGKGIPDGFGTFLNTFQYKNWALTVDLQYMYGNDVLDRSIHSAEDRQGIANSYKTVLNAWTETNQNTPIAQIRPINAYYTTNNDSHKVTDGSFIRGRNLLLAYTLPTAISSRLKLNRLRVYASVQNFFVATKFKGYDPEVSNSSAPFDQGLTLYDYPKPRIFMLGLNVGL